jgi:CRISPR system Cascade subunit CasC
MERERRISPLSDRRIEIHTLTSFPMSNPNRDEVGRPKTGTFGQIERPRMSSQTKKAAMRRWDEFFQIAGADNKGLRTKRLPGEIYKDLIDGGLTEELAGDAAAVIGERFAAMDKSGMETSQLVFYWSEELEAIKDLVETLIEKKRMPRPDELKLLRRTSRSVDLALHGRMITTDPGYSIEGALSVSHAFTVHAATPEIDFFTAVDDLNRELGKAGAAHMGEAIFTSGVYYQYFVLDLDLLLRNLGGNKDLATKAVTAVMMAIIFAHPAGKRTWSASYVVSKYVMAERGNACPRTLADAFIDPVKGPDIAGQSIERLRALRSNFAKSLDLKGEMYEILASEGIGTISELVEFAVKPYKA